MNTLADEYPKEQARIRQLIGLYHEIGPAGRFGALMLEDTLRRADVAAAEGDVVAMVQLYQEMRECK